MFDDLTTDDDEDLGGIRAKSCSCRHVLGSMGWKRRLVVLDAIGVFFADTCGIHRLSVATLIDFFFIRLLSIDDSCLLTSLILDAARDNSRPLPSEQVQASFFQSQPESDQRSGVCFSRSSRRRITTRAQYPSLGTNTTGVEEELLWGVRQCGER